MKSMKSLVFSTDSLIHLSNNEEITPMKELLLTLLAVYQTVNVRDNKPGAVLKTAGKLAEVGKLPLGSTIHTCTIAGEVYPKPSNLVSVLQDFMPDKPFKFTTKAGESYSATKADQLGRSL